MTKDKNESVEDYTARAVQLKKDLHGTEKENQRPEFIRKWRQGFGEILAPTNLVIDDLSQNHPKLREDVPLFQVSETTKVNITKHTAATRTNTTTPQRFQSNNYNINYNFTTTSKAFSDKFKDQELKKSYLQYVGSLAHISQENYRNTRFS